jgi:signal transduction histidine kinase
MIALVAQECARYNVPLDCQLPGAPAQEAHEAQSQQLHTQNLQMQSLQIQGVPRLLRRLVRNLLENAQRYGRGSVQVTLRFVPHLQTTAPPYPAQTLGHSAPTARNAIEIQVCDRGPGVPVAERARIFEPFYRSSSASERDGGVGLGLALVQSIAQSHGGSATCLGRDDGTGACFVVHITGC